MGALLHRCSSTHSSVFSSPCSETSPILSSIRSALNSQHRVQVLGAHRRTGWLPGWIHRRHEAGDGRIMSSPACRSRGRCTRDTARWRGSSLSVCVGAVNAPAPIVCSWGVSVSWVYLRFYRRYGVGGPYGDMSEGFSFARYV